MTSVSTTRQIFPASAGGFINGQPLMPIEATGPEDSVLWVDARLQEALKQGNRVSWAQGQLKVIADMLRDRGQPEIAGMLNKIDSGLSSHR